MHSNGIKRDTSSRKRGIIPATILAGILVYMGLCALGISTEHLAKANEMTGTCAGNMHRIGQALLMYSLDNDGEMPPPVSDPGKLNQQPDGWVNRVRPYFGSTENIDGVFRCPNAPFRNRETRRIDGGYTSYWINCSLQGVGHAQIPNDRLVQYILLGEGDDGIDKPNFSYCKRFLPERWKDKDSPANRHIRANGLKQTCGANYLLGSGHVAFLTFEQAKNLMH